MTDKMIDNRNGMELEPLSATDDQLLQAFFADNRMEAVSYTHLDVYKRQGLHPAVEVGSRQIIGLSPAECQG